MAYPFTIQDEIDVDATPEQAWQAISSGPHLDSWFMGTSAVEPRVGGAVRTDVGGFTLESTITAWDPPSRLVYRSPDAPDGAYTEFGWRIAHRANGGATLHFTHRGCLAGDDGQAEYEALKKGDPMYLRKLACYLEFFNGKVAALNVAVQGPPVASLDAFWSALRPALGLHAGTREWDAVHATVEGVGTLEGVVDYLTHEFLGVRSETALYRFMYTPFGTTMVEHHDFSGAHGHTIEGAWQRWLGSVFTSAPVTAEKR